MQGRKLFSKYQVLILRILRIDISIAHTEYYVLVTYYVVLIA